MKKIYNTTYIIFIIAHVLAITPINSGVVAMFSYLQIENLSNFSYVKEQNQNQFKKVNIINTALIYMSVLLFCISYFTPKLNDFYGNNIKNKGSPANNRTIINIDYDVVKLKIKEYLKGQLNYCKIACYIMVKVISNSLNCNCIYTCIDNIKGVISQYYLKLGLYTSTIKHFDYNISILSNFIYPEHIAVKYIWQCKKCLF